MTDRAGFRLKVRLDQSGFPRSSAPDFQHKLRSGGPKPRWRGRVADRKSGAKARPRPPDFRPESATDHYCPPPMCTDRCCLGYPNSQRVCNKRRFRAMPRTPVALVLAGQLSDHFRSVFPLLNATLLSTPEFDVDVFVCTWNTLGSSVHTQRHTPRHSESALLVAEQPWHLYGDRVVALRLERPSLNMSYTLHNLSIPRELAEKAGHWSWSTLPHLWLQSRCRREILLSGTSYRAVVAIRPDSKFWTPAVAAGLVWSVRNLDASWRDGGGEHKIELFLSPFALPTPRHASDKYAVGTQHAMLYYLDGWRAAPAYWSRPPWNRSSWGESVLL